MTEIGVGETDLWRQLVQKFYDFINEYILKTALCNQGAGIVLQKTKGPYN